MFTGLVADIGIVAGLERTADGAKLRIETSLAPELAPGDSVAVSGVCLTAAAADARGFAAAAMNETLSVTTLGGLAENTTVNVELAMRASDRLGGHIVQGHVDGMAEVISATEDGISRRLRLGAAPGLVRYLIERGSVTLDGVSLTIAAIGEGWFEVALIPETLERTNLSEAVAGRPVNVECDVLAKYVERLMSPLLDKDGG